MNRPEKPRTLAVWLWTFAGGSSGSFNMEYDAKTREMVARVVRLIEECAFPSNLPEKYRIPEYDSIREHIQELRMMEMDHECDSKENSIIHIELDRLRELKWARSALEKYYHEWDIIETCNVTDKITKENILHLLNGLGQILENITYGYPLTNRVTKSQISIVESISIGFKLSKLNIPECSNDVATPVETSMETLAEWNEAISSASLRPAARRRLEIWLKRKAGAKISVLELEYPGRNINRDLRDARSKDVPALMLISPTLSPLDG